MPDSDPFYHLKGADIAKETIFFDLDAVDREPTEVIFPIFSGNPDGDYHAIGTGFFINKIGLFATAGHVIEDCVARWEAGVPSFVLHKDCREGKFQTRRVAGFWRACRGDIGVGLLKNANNPGEWILNRTVALTMEDPVIGTKIATYAFPNVRTVSQGPGKSAGLFMMPYAYRGKLIAHFPVKRDTVLNGPCYQTDMHIHSGASGGPVFDEIGRVFAINSSSLQYDESVSFVSSIEPLFHFHWPYIAEEGRIEKAHINAFTKTDLAAIIPPMTIKFC